MLAWSSWLTPWTDFPYEKSSQTAWTTRIRCPWRSSRGLLSRALTRLTNAGSGCGHRVGGASQGRQEDNGRRRREASPTRSAESTDRVNPEAPRWTKRLRIGSAPPDRKQCPSFMSALEQSTRKYAEEPTKSVVCPEL